MRAWDEALSRVTVREACAHSQTQIDALLQSPPLRRPGAQTAETVNRLRDLARVSAAGLEGIELSLAAYNGIRHDGSPLSQTIRATEALLDASRVDADLFVSQPMRVLARWHVLATSASAVSEDERGRPRRDSAAVTSDPLNSGIEPARAGDVLTAVMLCVTNSDFPAVAMAAIVHGLIAAGQPFAHANAMLARCAARAVLVARGADPDGVVPFEAAIIGRGRPSYVRALTQLRIDAQDGDAVVRWASWVQWHSSCVEFAAKNALADQSDESTGNASPRA